CRYKQDRYIGKRLQFLAYFTLVVACAHRVFFYKIPFVYKDNNTFAVFFGKPEDTLVLALKATGSIYNKDTDITMLNCPYRAHYRIELKVFLNLCLTADTGSIYKIKFKPKTVIFCINCIAGS